MSLKTGYFAKQKKYEELGYTCISIARVKPNWFRGSELKILSPSYELLEKYKAGFLSEDEYARQYTEYLKMLDLQVILSDYIDKKVVLLCYEKPSSFCHRHILADYLEFNNGINVDELIV